MRVLILAIALTMPFAAHADLGRCSQALDGAGDQDFDGGLGIIEQPTVVSVFKPYGGGDQRYTGSLRHPPVDASTTGNTVVIERMGIGSWGIQVKSADYNESPPQGKANWIGLGGGLLERAADGHFTATDVDGRKLTIVRTQYDDGTMLLVTITTHDGSAVSAYVMI